MQQYDHWSHLIPWNRTEQWHPYLNQYPIETCKHSVKQMTNSIIHLFKTGEDGENETKMCSNQ